MIDIKKIREQADETEKKLRTKDPEISLAPLVKQDEYIRELKTTIEEKRSTLNRLSKEIGEKKRQGEDVKAAMESVAGLGDEISSIEHLLKDEEKSFLNALSSLPNLPDDDIKVSLDKEDNVCVKSWGEKRDFSFTPKNHLELNEKLHLLDFARGAKLAGAGWPVYTNIGARLEWALLNYMIDTHLKNGFTFMLTPHLVKREVMFGSGQLPKFEQQLFKLDDDDYPLMLIPTGEVSINGLHMDEIFDEKELPKKYITYTPCFRREAGASGAGERGLIRVHQFNKVEMYCFAKAEESNKIFQEMMDSAEEILQGLNLHYRNMLLVTGDMSFASQRTIDIEVFLPGQNRYYEVSSVSNCGDYQARRSKIRCRKGNDKPQLIHTLNGSGLATARLLVALLENNQNEDGSVMIPKVLQRYLGDIECLKP